MTNTIATHIADQHAALLRDRRCCDALDPCAACKAGRAVVQVSRAAALVPAQRKGVEA